MRGVADPFENCQRRARDIALAADGMDVGIDDAVLIARNDGCRRVDLPVPL